MSDNANNCGDPPIPEGCTDPLPTLFSLTFDEHQCGYMGGKEMLVVWDGSAYRGRKTFVKPSGTGAGPYFYDIVLRYRDGAWEMENFGCFHHLEPGGVDCDPLGMIFDMSGHLECGCSSQGGFEVTVNPAP